MKKILVKTSQAYYPVYTGDFDLKEIADLIDSTAKCKNYFVVIDDNVNRIYGKNISKVFNSKLGNPGFYSINSSEKLKSVITVQKIYNELAKNNFNRDGCLIAIGGGIVGDIGGFAASTYIRGIKYVQVPTTLLSAVDSSIGGKTGYNFNNIKNLIGTFYQPVSVITSTKFFNSLPFVQINSGIGEIIKYCFISGKKLYDYVYSNFSSIRSLEKKLLTHIINECISIKTSVVSFDEKEKNIRKILNFGHTFAHAFESYFNYKISHGIAVTTGIMSAINLSYKTGLISADQIVQFPALPLKINLPAFLNRFDNKKVINIMKMDKKNRSGKLKFVLIRNFGELVIDAEVNLDDLNWSLDALKKLISV